MRKPAIIAVCLLALATMLGAAGTQQNPLITREWLVTTYREQLRDELTEALADKFAAEERLLTARISGGTPMTPRDDEGEFLFTDRNAAVRLGVGQGASLSQGTLFSVSSMAVIELYEGTLLDLTSGEILASVPYGGIPVPVLLEQSRRYMLAEQSSGYMMRHAEPALTLYVDGWYALDTGEHPVFADVFRGDWFYAAVDFVYNNGYFRGTSENEFSPQLELTRAMFVTVLHRLDGEPEVLYDAPAMSDADDPALYYYDAVRWGVVFDIVRGFDDGTFRPNDGLTREQMAALLYRYAAYRGIDVSANPERAESFPDWDDVSDYAQDAFRWACDREVIRGSDGLLSPGSLSTRAQVAQMIMNFVPAYME